MMHTLKCMIFLIILLINIVHSYKILVFFPNPGKSHAILGNGLVKNLIDAGHNVTFVTPTPFKNSSPNLRQIDVSSIFGKHPFLSKFLDIKRVVNSGNMNSFDVYYELSHDISVLSLMDENVQELFMDPNESFDVVIPEWLYSDLYAGLAAVFNCPYIWLSSLDPHAMVLRLIDDVPNPAYVPNILSPTKLPLSFTERVKELWSLMFIYKVRWSMLGKENQAWEEAFGPAVAIRGRKLPSLDEVRFNASLMFGNSHVSTGLPIRLPQNYIPIGGYHIDRTVPPLPQNLQKLMDDSPQGVIYFSLGTLMEAKTLPDELKKGFLKIFGELKQTVIWKFEENMPNLPKNVHTLKWAPQQSILAHPNTVLFITHGGLLSTTESVHFGMPIIGIPLMADQFINIKRATTKGFAVHVDIGYDADVKLKKAIEDVLGNPKYRERVKELSMIYHDRPVNPGDEVVHWTEHVIKTRGAPHLRSPALIVPWYQKMYLDLLAIVIVGLVVIVIVLKKVFLILRGSPKIKQN